MEQPQNAGAPLCTAERPQSSGNRLTDYFLTLHDVIGPRPQGDALELVRCELEALRCPDCAGFVNAILKDLANQDEDTRTVVPRMTRERGLSNADAVALGIVTCRGLPNARMIEVRAAGKIGRLIAEALRSRNKNSGLNATIYSLYTMLFKLERDGGEHGSQIGEGELRGLSSDAQTHVVFDFFKVDPFVHRRDHTIKNRADDEDAMHRPFVLHARESVFPPLTAFYRPSADAKWEPTFSMQLLTEHLIPTPEVWEAVQKGSREGVETFLVTHPTADLEFVHPKYGCNLLYSACRFGHLPIVELLVKHCADISSGINNKKNTPLHAAAWFDFHDVVRFLLQHGAPTDVKNADGYTPAWSTKTPVSPIAVSHVTSSSSIPDDTPQKMLVDAEELHFGSRSDFLVGLRGMVGRIQTSMEWEFTGREVDPWDDAYGHGYDAKILWDRAKRAALNLQNHPTAVAAQLSLEDLIALRAYTGPSYRPLNKFLRKLGRAVLNNDSDESSRLLAPDQTWAATATILDAAMSKLLAVTEVEDNCELARGIKGKLPTEFYIPDERGMIVMTDHGFVSSTHDPAVAEGFLAEGSRPSVLLKLQCRKRDAFGHHFGVNLSWVSEYKDEAEVLFPPFTVINIIRKQREGLKVVLTGVPTFAPTE